jgi:hypothetical protein
MQLKTVNFLQILLIAVNYGSGSSRARKIEFLSIYTDDEFLTTQVIKY